MFNFPKKIKNAHENKENSFEIFIWTDIDLASQWKIKHYLVLRSKSFCVHIF